MTNKTKIRLSWRLAMLFGTTIGLFIMIILTIIYPVFELLRRLVNPLQRLLFWKKLKGKDNARIHRRSGDAIGSDSK